MLLLLDLLSPQASTSLDGSSGYHPQKAYKLFFLPCFAVSTAAMVLGALCLSFDLGRPDRLINLFFNPTFSYLTIGTYALAIAILCAGFLTIVWSGLGAKKGCSRWLVRCLEILGILSASAVILYTGLLFYSIGAGTLLDSLLIPLLFILSALSCGIALIFATTSIADATVLFKTTLQRLARIDSVLLLLELLALAALVLLALLSSASFSAVAAQTLLWGSEAVVFWLILNWFLLKVLMLHN